MKRSTKILICVIAGLIGVVMGIAIVGLFSFRGLASREELSAAEKGLLIQVDDFVAFGITPREGVYLERFRAKTNVDGSLELEYEYESDAPGEPITIKSEAEICSDAATAGDSFGSRVMAYKIRMKLSGKEGAALEERPELLSIGDQHYSALLVRQGVPRGNMVVIRQNCTIYSLILNHVFVDDRSDLESLFAARLAGAGSVVLE